MAAALLLVPFREVRHDQPDDCLHYESVAVRGAEMDWTIPAHRHEGLHQFQFLRSGAASGTIDGRAFETAGPALLMMAPGSTHGFSYGRDVVGHQVTLPTSTLRQLLGGSELVELHLGESFVVGAPGDALAIGSVFDQVAAEFAGREPGRAPALLALATLIATHFVRARGVLFERDRRGARDALAQRFATLVERHYAEHRPLDFYAATLGVTPDHLSRVCRGTTGRSALQTIHERLMLEARRLLVYTPMPVAGVAEQLGYADAAYFTKFFARAVGHTPKRYRALVARGVQRAAN
jgi:AraC family transcriptional regulator, transcriptional activator of pobA